MKTLFLITLPLLVAAPVGAQPLPGLPDAAVREAIDAHPRTRAAEAKVDAARQEARALRTGPHEFTVSGDYVNRSVAGEGDFKEYSVILERPIRLPGKGALDRKAGDLTIAVSALRAEDTRHQLALQLNELWWDWLRAGAEARILAETQATLERSHWVVERQVKAEDAALVDADRAMAEVALNEAALGATQGRVSVARDRLVAQFAGLALPAEVPPLPLPALPMPELARLREAVTTCNHELPAAMAEADRLTALSERRRRDRLADPTIGARIFSERGGMEKGAGVVFSVPFGGRHRAALSDQAAAEARAAVADAAIARRDVEEMATTDFSEAVGTVRAWEASQVAVASSTRAVERLRAGHRLGHVDLADLLYGERQAKDALLAESIARAAALRAEARLRIDAHALWLDCDH